MSRRRFMAGSAAATLLGGTGAARAADRMVATTYPGAWEEAQRAFLLPVVKRDTKSDVVLTVSQAVDTLAKITAARATPPFDAIIMDEGPYRAALDLDVFAPLPTASIPNLAALPPEFIDPQGMGAFVSAQIVGIAYNPKRITTPPTSWLDLWDPRYKGRVGLTNMGSSLGTAWMVEIAKLHGGGEDNMDPAFAALRTLLPNVGAIAPNPGALGTLFQQGQIDITFNFLYVVLPLQARGVDVAFAMPASGGVLVRNSLHIVKNCRAPELAAAYINAALGVEVQSKLAEAPYFFAPTNPKVRFGSELARVAPDNAALAKITNTNWAKINPQRAALIDRFNREIQS
ncbi:MAG: extracellular solute-binding protein [Alphaproteobacteria bacterium]|nr:extracellular solute-binding protein [Alphaproteobacteria bacterium]